MNRTVIGLAGGIAVLGALTFWVTQDDAAAPPPSLEFEGFASADQIAAEDERGMLDPRVDVAYPIDEIVVKRAGEELRLKRTGEGKELGWSLESPVTSRATKFQVEKMVNLFKTPTRSVYATTASPEELSLFDLEPERRISITMRAGGSVWQGVDLVLGKVDEARAETADGGVAKDTWVMVRGDDSTVYRIAGKDLREPFEVKLDALRDKAVFDVDAEDLTGITITAPDGSAVRLAGERGQVAEPGSDSPTKPKVTWTLAEPTGYTADRSADGLARNVANLRTKAFVASADAPEGALGKTPWRIRATTHDGRALSVAIADGDSDEVWAKIEGSSEYLKLDKFTARNLRKTLADVRSRGLLLHTADTVTGLSLSPPDAGEIVVAKRDGSWQFVQPRTKGLSRADADGVVKSLLRSKATRYARPDETDEARKAISEPEFQAAVTGDQGRIVLVFGPKMEEDPYKGQRWATLRTRQGDSDPFLVQDSTAARFRKTVDDLRWKKVFDVAQSDMQAVQITWPQDAHTVNLTRAEGQSGLSLLQVPDGKKAKDAAVRGIASTLASLKAKAFLTDKKAKDVGLTPDKAFTVGVAKGGDWTRMLLSEEKEGGNPYAMALDGPLAGLVITVNSYQADKLKKKVDDLVE